MFGGVYVQLTREDLDKIYYDPLFLFEQVDLSIGSYYTKFCNTNSCIMEIFAKKIFDMVGIKCAEYEYILEHKCLLSKDLNVNQKMYTPYDFGIMRANTLEQVMNGLERVNIEKGYNIDKVRMQFEILHFIDILFSNIDRHITNFGFYIQKDSSLELVVFDNEYFLQNFKTATRPMACGDDEIDSDAFIGISKEYEVSCFFENISNELSELTPKYMELFSPDRVFTLINSVEDESGLLLKGKKTIVKDYKRNYKMICRMIKYNKNKRISLYKK